MAAYPRHETRALDEVNGGGSSEEQSVVDGQLRATANLMPAHVWYATPSGALVFVNSRSADYLGLPRDHPLRFGIDLGGEWDCHIPSCTQRIAKKHAEFGLPVFAPATRARWPFEFVMLKDAIDGS